MSLNANVSRKMIVGWLFLASAVLYLLGQAFGLSAYFSALCAWLGVMVFWPSLGGSAKRQTGILLLLGIALLGWAWLAGAELQWQLILTRNMPLLTMFVAVSFLSLANPPEQENQLLPKGRRGFWSTLFSTHLLGAVINLSVVFVVSDRLKRNEKLTDAQLALVMRSFCAAAFWSPFFVATGVALTYAPGAHWQQVVVPGLLMVLPLVLISFWDVYRSGFDKFEGYPVRRDSLLMPVLLATSVLILHELLPKTPILLLISMLAPIGALIFMHQRPRLRALKNYVDEKQANVSSQFSLFLAAGVFSTGISTLISCYPNLMQLQMDYFSPLLFLATSMGMILFALVGVHPVVTVAIVSPFLLPLGADPNQLAFLFLSVWGIATASSPLSGVGLAMISRYQAEPKQILKLQWRYMLFMWLSSGLLNWWWFS